MKRGLALSSVDIPMAIMGCGENRVGRKAWKLKSGRLCFFFSLKKKSAKQQQSLAFSAKKAILAWWQKTPFQLGCLLDGQLGRMLLVHCHHLKVNVPVETRLLKGIEESYLRIEVIDNC